MNFSGWLNESSLNDLYDSAVDAFPNTAKRQHAVDPIRITQLSIIPFKGVKTLFFKGLAQNEDREYNPIIVFKAVRYHNGPAANAVEVMADDGIPFYVERLSPKNDVLVRCECGDFYWRFNYYDHLDHSLQGKKRTKYEGAYRINPKELPGMCKHLIKLTQALKDADILIS